MTPIERRKDEMREASGPLPTIPRRVVLTGAGAAVAAGALVLGAGPANTPLLESPPTLRDRWIEAITARSRMLNPTERMRTHLHPMDEDVRTYLDSADDADDRDVFSRFPFDREEASAFSMTATWLATMAKAWSTPGSAFSLDDRVHRTVLDGVERLLEAGYHEGAEAYANWWDWEIGTPRPLSDILCLFRDELPGETLDDAVAAIRYFLPDPTYSRLMNYPTTASGRVNTIRGALIAAIAEEDDERIRECVEALPAAWRIVDGLDGFYEDGGFIHHLDIPYTGNYGTDLLRSLAPMLMLLEDTEFEVEGREELWDLVDSAYLPVMVNGHVLDAVRGRAVARLSTNGSVTGRGVAGAIAQVSRTAPRERRARWTALLRKWAEHNPTLDLLEGADLPGAVALEETTRLPYEGVEEPPTTYFASMDRLVHRAGPWSMALSMCSNRIAAYEGTEEENSWGVLTGNSMRYLFIGDDPSPFDDHFWATLDYARPPGTTNHRVSLTPASTRGSSENRPSNEWTGGFVHGELSASATNQVNRAGEAPECRRFTVAGPESIIEMVSDIRTDLDAFTTVENRMFPNDARSELTVDGEPVGEPTALTGASWAHIDDVGGYLFPEGAAIDAGVTRRVGSTRRVERGVDSIPRSSRVSRRWATLDLRHDARAAWWVLLPAAAVDATRAAASDVETGAFPARMVRNDGAAQVVSIEDTTMIAAVWTSTTIELSQSISVRCEHPVLIAAERSDEGIVLRLAEPTQSRQRTEVTVSGQWEMDGVDDIDPDDVAVRVEGTRSRLTVSTSGRGGAAFTVRLVAA